MIRWSWMRWRYSPHLMQISSLGDPKPFIAEIDQSWRHRKRCTTREWIRPGIAFQLLFISFSLLSGRITPSVLTINFHQRQRSPIHDVHQSFQLGGEFEPGVSVAMRHLWERSSDGFDRHCDAPPKVRTIRRRTTGRRQFFGGIERGLSAVITAVTAGTWLMVVGVVHSLIQLRSSHGMGLVRVSTRSQICFSRCRCGHGP